MKKYRFPLIPDVKFQTEALLYHRMDIKYKTLFINEIIAIIEYLDDGLTDNYFKIMAKNSKSALIFYNELNFFKTSFSHNIRNNSLYIKYSLLSGASLIDTILLSYNKFYTLLAIPRGIMRYLRARRKIKFL